MEIKNNKGNSIGRCWQWTWVLSEEVHAAWRSGGREQSGRDSLESPVNLFCMFLQRGRKPEYPNRELNTPRRARTGIEPRRFLPRGSADCADEFVNEDFDDNKYSLTKKRPWQETAPPRELKVREYLPWMIEPFRTPPSQPPFQPQHRKQCQFSKKPQLLS